MSGVLHSRGLSAGPKDSYGESPTCVIENVARKPEIVGGERMGGFNQAGISISMQVADCLHVQDC